MYSKSRRKGIDRLKTDLERVHKGLVVLVEESYVNLTTMCLFDDLQYGIWKGLPITVKNGGRYPQFRADKKTAKFSTPTDDLKSKLNAIHGDTLEYDWSTFRGIGKKMTVIDKDFGEWRPYVIGLLNGKKHRNRANAEMTVTYEEASERLFKTHGNQVLLKKESYRGMHYPAIFIDCEHGEWKSNPANVIDRGSSHPNREMDKRKETCLSRYGVDSANKVPEISLKKARSQTKSSIKIHWKTGEELVCQASWEPKVIDYLNAHKIDFSWQSETFILPSGKTYRPDLFLINENKWIEIKGYFRKDAKEKWDWFQSQYPNSELWDEKKLKQMGVL